MARGGALADPAGGPAGAWAAGPEGLRAGWFAGLSVLVAAVIYGPMLRPGYPLRYDLVSVPHPVLGRDALGLGDRLPRAVPLDAATAVLARVLPDDLLTQILALLALTLAGWGVAALTPAPLPGRLLALLVAQWNPFVLEQLAIGHIPHLFAYGALPWVAIFGRSLTRGGPSGAAGVAGAAGPGGAVGPAEAVGPVGAVGPAGAGGRGALRDWAGLVAAAGFGSLTPGGGVLCLLTAGAALTAGAVGGAPNRGRRGLAGAAALVVLQLPWAVAALAAPALAGSGAEVDQGITAFALRSETGWGRLIDAAGLAGMWNGAALPASRDTVLAKVSTVLLLSLAAAGTPAVRRLWRAGHGPEVLAGAAVAGSGYLVAVLPVLPGGRWLLRTLTDLLPEAGLLRDGHRWLALPAVGIAVLCGLGVSELAARLTSREPPVRARPDGDRVRPDGDRVRPDGDGVRADGDGVRADGDGVRADGDGVRAVAVTVFVALLVVASMPDLAGGLDGRLAARHYPAAWNQVRSVLDRSPDRARVLVLPWQPFRVFGWSGPAPVLDPAPRLLPRPSLVSDALTVAGRRLPEEGPGARAVQADLADGTLSSARLRSLAVGWVLIEHGTPGIVPRLPAGWRTVVSGPQLSLLRAPGILPRAPGPGIARAGAVIGTQLVAGLLFLLSVVLLIAVRLEAARPARTG